MGRVLRSHGAHSMTVTGPEAIGYAFAILMVSPVVLAVLAAAMVTAFAIGVLVWESRKAQVALAVVWLIYGGARLVMWVASRPPSPPESCAQRCDGHLYQDRRRDCLYHCFEAEKMIRENGQ